MGRPKDEHYWNQVTKEENGTLKCKHCGHKFKGGVSRIKAHVDRKQGQGIAICSINRDNDILHNNIISGSNNSQEAINAVTPLRGGRETINTYIGDSINHQSNTDFINLLGGWSPVHTVNTSNDINTAFESEISHLNKLVSDLTYEEGDIKKQLQWLESRGKKRKRPVDTWLKKLAGLKKRALVINNLQELQFGLTSLYGMEIQQLIEDVQKHREQKPVLLSNEFVGENFEKNIKKMWKLLEDDQVFIICIHGMGGVGKTFLATHMENEIKREGTFKHVFWVPVSHDFSIFQLQHDIAQIIGIKLYGDHERTRAANLSLVLETKEKSVLILDDIWKSIDLQKVGIPLRVNGIKVIITCRLEHVCRQMCCVPNDMISTSMIQMCPLSNEEAWELFRLQLGQHGTPARLLSTQFDIARSVAKECDGLPLGINVMARSLKGSPYTWKHALNKLQKLEMGEEMKEEVLKVLKRSFDNLIEKDMQKCFLYCALLPDIEAEDAIMRLVDSGLINDKGNLEEIFDEGEAIFNKLRAHSLLLSHWPLRMHGLIRNMAYLILKESHKYMVKYNRGLTKIPHTQEWTSDLEVASLMRNNIGLIPEGTSPCCPRLSTLILFDNSISHIPECFFRHMNALAILDLSDNDRLTSLPNSVSNLRSLISLMLTGCSKLEYIPPLGELQALARLDISGCSILQAPQGLENLINLKWLDLCKHRKAWKKSVTLVPGICVLPDLSHLTNMQYLDIRTCSGIKVEDVQGMSMLECFGCCFDDRNNYNHYMQKIQDGNYGPEAYIIHLGKFDVESCWELANLTNLYPYFKCRSVCFGDCEELLHLLPINLTELSVYDNNQWVCLCSALSSSGPSSLKSIHIINCTKLTNLFCSSSSCSTCTNIQNLKSLHLADLRSLNAICKEDVADLTQYFSPMGVFSHLGTFDISNCHEIEKLLTPGLVQQLQNLWYMSVSSCNSMKEIFAVSDSDDDDSSYITLPRLSTLSLTDLPQLKTVCKGILFCESSEILYIDGCPNLEMLPTIQVLCDSDNSDSDIYSVT